MDERYARIPTPITNRKRWQSPRYASLATTETKGGRGPFVEHTPANPVNYCVSGSHYAYSNSVGNCSAS